MRLKHADVKEYRKKPLIIEAVKIEADDPIFGKGNEKFKEILNWIGWAQIEEIDYDPLTIWLHTPEGIMMANYGDYIIRGVKGEFYPCKPDIFEKTYEEVK